MTNTKRSDEAIEAMASRLDNNNTSGEYMYIDETMDDGAIMLRDLAAERASGEDARDAVIHELVAAANNYLPKEQYSYAGIRLRKAIDAAIAREKSDG